MKRFWILLTSISLLISMVSSTSQANAATEFAAWAPCSISNSAPCIESFSYIDSSGSIIQGKLSGRTKVLKRDISLNKYDFTEYEWSLPGLKQASGSDKMLLLAYYFPLNTPYCWLPDQDPKTCDYGIDQIIFDVGASWWDSQPPPTHFLNSDRDDLCGTRENPAVCISGWDLNKDMTYEVVVRLPKDFQPRMLIGFGTSGDLKISKGINGEKTATVRVKPAMTSWAWNVPQRPINFKDVVRADVSTHIINFALHSDKAAVTQWLNTCSNFDEISVWNNSSESTLPYWISSEKALALNVSSIHLRADGTQNIGTFEVQMPVKLAQCLWGVDLSKSVSATISAVYGEGNASEIVTTSAKIENDFYYLKANGFHYSSPTIKVKLTQTPTIPTSLKPAAEIKPLVKKKLTIKCVKGNQVRKVTAYQPKCLAGYKEVK